MSLEQLIADYAQAEFDAQDFAGVLAILNAETVELRNEERFDWADVADVLGPAETEKLRIALDANGLGFANLQLGGGGLLLNHDEVWPALNALNASPAIDLQPLLDEARYDVSPAVLVGLKQRGELVTQAELDVRIRAVAVNGITARNNAAIAAAEAAAESEMTSAEIEQAARDAWGA